MSRIVVTAWVLGIPTVRISGTDRGLQSLHEARERCCRAVPGLALCEGGETDVPFQLQLESDDAALRHWQPGPGGGTLTGQTEELTSDVWSDLLLTLSAHALAAQGLFFMAATAVRVRGILWGLVQAHDGEAEAAGNFLRNRGCEVLHSGRLLVDGCPHFPPVDRGNLAAQGNPSEDGPVAVAVERWCHIRLVPGVRQVQSVPQFAQRAVLASHMLSSSAMRPAVVGVWRLILSEFLDDAGEQRLHAAILSQAALPHWRFFGSPGDLAGWLENHDE
jgi:hypothetical protein